MNSSDNSFSSNKNIALFINSSDEWKDDENLILSNKCKFYVQYLGTTEINDPLDLAICCATLKDLIGKKKLFKSVLKISTHSLMLFDKSTNEIKVDQTLKEIISCSSHPGIPYTFFYTSRDTLMNAFQLSGFISMKEVSDRIITAILFALKVYCEKQVESSNLLSSYSKSQEIDQGGKSFKQNSLIERYQDPQSSIILSKLPTSKTVGDFKSIPRRRCSKFKEKISSDLFPNLNLGDLFKRNEADNGGINNSNTGRSSQGDLANIAFPNNAFTSNFETQFALEEHCSNLNQADRINCDNQKIQIDNAKNGNFPINDQHIEHNQYSKYDIFKNINKPFVHAGWSEQIIGGNKPKSQSTNFTSTDFDEFLTGFLENINKK